MISGRAPQNQEQMDKIEEQVRELYWAFYFGEKTTPIERELEQAYLSAKQMKHIRA